MFRNILVAVDGSQHAERALNEAIELANAAKGRLTILTAVPRAPAWASTPAVVAACQPLGDELEREAGKILRDAEKRVPRDLPVTTILTPKPIRRALLTQISAGRHDLVVMGSRGRGAFSASLLGSVSHHVLHHSPVPVLIIHTEGHCDHAEGSAAGTTKTLAGSKPTRPNSAPAVA